MDKFIPIQEDPSIPRPLKRTPILDSEGNIIGYKQPVYDSSVMPSPEDVLSSPIIDCSSPVQYQQLFNNNQSVDIVTDPNIDILDTIDTIKNL